MGRASGIRSRWLGLALATAFLASGSVHFHPGEPLAAEWVDPASGELRSAASHPASPIHVESVELERAPSCLDCLLRQRDHSLGAPGPAISDLTLAPAERPAEIRRAVLRRARAPGQPRGPPLA